MSVLSTHSRRAFVRARDSGTGVLLVAHGSRDPRAAPVAADVADTLAEAGIPTRAAFLELSEPNPDTALDALSRQGVRSVVIVPFLLGHAYHAKTDVPGVRQAALERQLDTNVSAVLGPDPLLADAAARKIAEIGSDTEAIVVAAAGSSDPDGNAGAYDLASRTEHRYSVPTTVGFASATRPTVEEAVRAASRSSGRVLVVTYLLAPGYFGDKIRAEGLRAGASAVTASLGNTAEVADLVARRALSATPVDD